MGKDQIPGNRKNSAKFPGKNHYTNNDTVRIQRNQAEKQRRDRLNDLIAQLATLVPPAMNASKPLDKVNILRLSASWLRLNFSCLNEKRFKSAIVNYLDMHHSLVSNLDILEKSINGFIIATTFSGIVLMCSRYSEEYIGYQNIDLLGHNISNFVLPKEKNLLMKKMRNLISRYKNGCSNPRDVVRVRMQQRPLPRCSVIRYRNMCFTLSIHSGGETPRNSENHNKSLIIGRQKDFGESAVILIFVEPVQLEPNIDIQYLEQKDCYFTMHGPLGEIVFADHRISIITGYMSQDVLGNSAYEYIHSSDVPIALFAQKEMFASSDGTGIITYRLRIHDSSFIYLQTKGQIRYKDSDKEVRQFVCCNILLNDEDGSRELKKFQDRYAPQINSSKDKLKGIRLLKESRNKINADCYSLAKNNESLKRKTSSPPLNNLMTNAPIKREKRNTAKNLFDFCAGSKKNNYRVDYDQSHLLSSNSKLYSSDNSLKRVVDNEFDNDSPTIQVITCKRAKFPESLSCSVQDNLSIILTSDPTSPEHSMTHSNDNSISHAKDIYFGKDHVSLLHNSAESTLLTSYLVLTPEDLAAYDTASEKNLFSIQDKLMSSQYINPNDIQNNCSEITFTDNIKRAIENLFEPQDPFQSHETICPDSLLVAVNNSLLQNSQININNHISHNHFVNSGPKFTDFSNSQSISKAQEFCAAKETVLTSEPQTNIDLSFLDQSVGSMALLSDLSDLYDNSMYFSKSKYHDKYQAEVISNSSDTEYCYHDSNSANGAIFQESDELGLYNRSSSDILNSNNSIQQLHDYSPNTSYITSDSDSVRTNDMLMKTLDGEYFPQLEQDWQTTNTSIHSSSLANRMTKNCIFNQIQTNATITSVDGEGHKPLRHGMHDLYPSMNTQPDFLNHAQNDEDIKKHTSTSVIQFLVEKTFE